MYMEMTEKTNEDVCMLLKKMEKYDFNKEFSVSVSIIESDHNMERSDLNTKGTNGEFISSDTVDIERRQNKNVNDVITSVYFENAYRNYKPPGDNNNNNINQNTNSSDKTAETQNKSQINGISSINSHSSAVSDNISCSTTESNSSLNQIDMLSKNIINILKAYNYYLGYSINCENTLIRKNCNEKYKHVKEGYFRLCREIAITIILPQCKKFHVHEFILRTMHIASYEDKLICTYENIQRVFNEIMASCYKQIVSGPQAMPVCHMSKNVINSDHNVLLHNSYQNHEHPKNITQPIHNGQYQVLQQSSRNNGHCNNLTETIYNTPNSGSQLQNDGHYNTARTHMEPNSVMLQNDERQTRNIANPRNNETNSVLQELLQGDGSYHNALQTIDKERYSISNAKYQNNSQLNKIKGSNITNTIFKQNTQNHMNLFENSSAQGKFEIPKTCVFQYRCPNYEVRLDVDTQILNNVSSSSQVNNEDPKKQCMTNYVRKSVQSTEYLYAPTNQVPYQNTSQEPTRSTSRDSGFMSPCSNQIIDACNDGEPTPFITEVTSLNPNARHIPPGLCHVCGNHTKKKCIGCYKYYYCSSDCQQRDWRRHRYDCTEIR